MGEFVFALLVGLGLTVAVFGSLLWLSERLTKSVIAPGSRFPFIPRLMGGIVALGLTFPSALWIVGHSPLEALYWGHSGVALLPGLLVGVVLTLLVRKWRMAPGKGHKPEV